MPVQEFVNKAWEQLAAGSELVAVGPLAAQASFKDMLETRHTTFENISSIMLMHYEL